MSRPTQSPLQAGHLFFEPASRLQQADKLSHLVRYSDFVLLVLGEEGSGKTRLLQEITPTDPQDSTLHVCAVEPQGPMDVPELMSRLLQQLPGHSRYGADQAGQLKALYEQVSAMRALGQRLLLLIDDADQLTDTALELLFNFMAAGGTDSKGAQAVLLGKPELETRLREARLLDQGEGRIHRTLLEPYADDEAREFLRLRYPTLQNQPKKKLEELLLKAAGLPGALESAALELLGSGAVASRGSARAFPFPLPHLAGIVFVLIAITGVATWQFMPQSESVQTDSVDRVEIELKVPAEGAGSTPPDDGTGDQARQVLAERLKQQERKIEAALRRVKSAQAEPVPEETAVVATVERPVSKTEEVPAEVAPVRAAAGTPLLTADKPLELALPHLREPASADPTARSTPPKPASPAVIASSTVKAPERIDDRSPAPIPVVKSAVKPAVKAVVSSKPTVEKKVAVIERSQPQPVAKKAQTVAEVAVKRPVSKAIAVAPVKPAVVRKAEPEIAQRVALSRQRNPILGWSASEYTLQMLGARDRATVNKFLRRQSNPERFHSFSTLYKGKPWHVLVYGRYSSRKAAVAATAKLPPELRKLRPWARSVQGVQLDIKKK